MKRGMTAGELMAQLAADPVFQEEERKRAELRGHRRRFLDQAQRDLLADLNAAGEPVSEISELVNTARPYPAAIPVLVAHLDRNYPPIITEMILRSLAVREARGAWPRLKQIFLTEPAQDIGGLKWAAAVALAGAADESVLDEVMDMLLNPELGFDRAAFLPVLKRLKTPQTAELLETLMNDPVIGKEAMKLRPRTRKKC